MNSSELNSLTYVEFMSLLGETNRPPGGKSSIREIVKNTFIDRHSIVLEVGCHTGFTSLEIQRLVGCRVVGLDMSPRALNVAKIRRGTNSLPFFVSGNAMALPFPDGIFDVVVCGGATAWIDDQRRAVSEYIRVTRQWGMIAAVPFFYAETPPNDLIDEINELIGIGIQKWKLNYWIELFVAQGLELYFSRTYRATVVNNDSIEDYISMLARRRFSPEVEASLYSATLARLRKIFQCFNRNNHYLGYSVLVFRVRSEPEEITLFD